MEQIMNKKQSKAHIESFVQGWNASLDELQDVLDEMEGETNSKPVHKILQDIRNWISVTEDYFQLIKVDK